MPFRLVTFNVWYRSGEHARVTTYLEQARADAVVLQEISTDQATRLQAHLPSYPYAYLEPGMRGAVVYSRWPILEAQRLELSSAHTPAAHVVLDWNGTALTLIGVHLHWPLGATNWRLRNQELQQLGEFARTRSGPLLIAGDFNITPWSAYFQHLLERAGLSDCAAGQGVGRSWPAQLPEREQGNLTYPQCGTQNLAAGTLGQHRFSLDGV